MGRPRGGGCHRVRGASRPEEATPAGRFPEPPAGLTVSAAVSRRTVLRATATLFGVACLPRAGAAGATLVEDWATHQVGARGVPTGWREYETPAGRPRYDFTIVDDGGRRALDLKSEGDHSTIAKEVQVELAQTPVLEWAWKVMRVPAHADLRNKATSDATGHVFVVWPRWPALLRSRLIGYVWDRALPTGSVVKSRKTGTVTFIVVASGEQGLREWRVQRRNVVEDYRKVFDETPTDPGAVALSIDTNDTRSEAETLFGRIAFAAR
jgi:hypothetical protein